MTRRHYTLTELCVSLLILLFLAAIGMPVLSAAAAQAGKTACADIQKRIADVAFAYSEDYGDYSVPHTGIGWMGYLSRYDRSITPFSFLCPEDRVERKYPGEKFSFSLNTGHIWNYPQTNVNKQEWGMVSPITGNPLKISRAPEPASTAWFREFWDESMNYRQVCRSGDRSAFTTYSLPGTHDNGTAGSILFLDGHSEMIEVKDWMTGDIRGVVFKEIHRACFPNMH